MLPFLLSAVWSRTFTVNNQKQSAAVMETVSQQTYKNVEAPLRYNTDSDIL